MLGGGVGFAKSLEVMGVEGFGSDGRQGAVERWEGGVMVDH